MGEKRGNSTGLCLATLIAVPVMYGMTSAASGLPMQFVFVLGCVGIALLLVLGLEAVFSKYLNRREYRLSEDRARTVSLVCGSLVFAVSLAAFCGRELSNSRANAPWAGLSPLLVTGGLTAAFFVLWALSRPLGDLTAKHRQVKLLGRAVCIALIAGVCFVCGASLYSPYLLSEIPYNWHHQTALTQSIYNVGNNVPFGKFTSSVYGHYAIFFWPFLKLFGAKPVVISTLIVILGVYEVLCVAYAAYKITGSWCVAALGAAAFGYIAVPGRGFGNYWQCFPLRFAWTLLLLVFLLARHKNGTLLRRSSIVWGFVICCLACVWNTDTGMALTLGYVGVLLMAALGEDSLFSRRVIRLGAGLALGFVAVVAGFIGIINLYNLCVGGELIFKECFFPMFGGYVGGLETPLDDAGRTGWFMPILLFFLCICAGFEGIKRFHAGAPVRDHRMKLMIIGVIGMGQSYYYLNRTIAGAVTVAPCAILALAAWLDLLFHRDAADMPGHSIWRGTLKGLAVFCAFELFALSAGTAVSAPRGTAERVEDLADFAKKNEEILSWVSRNVPEDAFAIGYGTGEIYAELGRDTGYHLQDVSDLGLGSTPEDNIKDVIREKIAGQQHFLIGGGVPTELYLTDDVFCVKGYESELFYYIRLQK